MRILTYNIWDGGGERLDAIAAVIRASAADCVALQEANAAGATTLASSLGMELTYGEADSMFGTDLAWLTRSPVRSAHNHRLPALSKALLRIEVGGVTLFTTHLASRHEEHLYPRAAEVEAILAVLSGVEDAHLLVGDLNALRPGDAIGTPPAGVEPRGDALPGAPRAVLGPIDAAGYVDCFRRLHPHEPGYTYPASAPWLRLDYVFASADVAERVRACEVIATAAARRASDHLPLLVELG